MIWVFGVLLTLLLGSFVLLRLLMRGHIKERHTIEIDGTAVAVEYRYGSKLPKFLGVGGTTINETLCFRAYPRRWRREIYGVRNVSKELVAHELGHVIDKHRKGFVRYWKAALWEIVTKRSHDDRMFERRASAYAILLLAGKAEGIIVGTALSGFE